MFASAMSDADRHRFEEDKKPRHTASMRETTPALARLRDLLLERNQAPDRVEEIDREIVETFQRKVSMLILDMCGFSRITMSHGIIFYLAMIQQMESAACPAVEQNKGQVVKQEADNLFAFFQTPQDALEAALDILRAFDAMNAVVPDERDIYGSIGIGFGDTLVIGDEDLFGDEMNRASRLGEDLAGQQDILLTASAYEELPEGLYRFETVRFQDRGGEITAYRFLGRVLEGEAPSPSP
jgi:class 3 adenylate cyclase